MSKLDEFDASGRHTDVDAALGEAEDYTRLTETPAERRLLTLVEDMASARRLGQRWVTASESAAIDMGREALALLRQFKERRVLDLIAVDALLARAGEE